MMECYKNINGNSGVVSYEIGFDFIWVVFSDGARYLYTYATTGVRNVDHMKQLATNGQGLNSFINTSPAVRKGYARKEQ